MNALYSGSLLPFAVLLWPLLVGVVPIVARARAWALWLLPLAPLPALLFAMAGAPGAVSLPNLVLGVELAATQDNAMFIGMTALIWIVAGWHAALTMARDAHTGVFASFWCLTLAGNLGVFLAADVVTFYVAFAAVSLAAWFLVVHDRTRAALAAGRLYITLAVVGEAALLIGLIIGARGAGDLSIEAVARIGLIEAPLAPLAVGLLIIGLGIKAGMVPLHIWLPVAHPAAPVPGSAVLSGAIVKAGLIGMLMFVPPALGWQYLLIILGFAGAFGAALWGLTQRNPKAVLAYSTVSQMGLMLALVGAGSGGVTLYALHHGLAKAALFLSVGLMALSVGAAQRRVVLIVAGLLALSVAGLPLSGGALAKLAAKDWLPGPVALAITLSGITTTLVLGWFMLRLWDVSTKADQPPAPWRRLSGGVVVLAVAAMVLPWLLWPGATTLPRDYALVVGNIIEGFWPIAIGLIALAVLSRVTLPTFETGSGGPSLRMRIRQRIPAISLPTPRWPLRKRAVLRALLRSQRIERRLLSWPGTGAVLMGAGVVLALLIGRGG